MEGPVEFWTWLTPSRPLRGNDASTTNAAVTGSALGAPVDLGARRPVRSDLPPSSISTTVAGPLMGTGESIRSSHPRSAPTAARPGRWPWGELPRTGSGVRSGGSLPRTRPRGPDLSQPVRNSGSTTSASHPARPPRRRRPANWCGSALGSGNEPRRLTQRWRRAIYQDFARLDGSSAVGLTKEGQQLPPGSEQAPWPPSMRLSRPDISRLGFW